MNNIYDVIARSRYPDKEVEGYLSSPIIGKQSIWNPLGDKLSSNEKAMMPTHVPHRSYFTVRLDGKGFSKIIPELKKKDC